MFLRRLFASTSAFALLLPVLLPQLLSAQVPQTRLLYDEGGVFSDPKTATIRLTGPNGQVPPDTAATQSADRVHFLYRPSGEWTFADDAPDVLRQILIQQNETRISPANVVLRREGGEPTAARVAYPRSELDWLTPVAFAHEVDTSATLSLPDVYAVDYPSLRRPYDRGRELIGADEPLRALDTLSVFYGEVTPAFAFVEKAKATLDTAAAAAVKHEADAFQDLRNEVVSDPSAELFDRLNAFQGRLDTLRAALSDYLNARPEAGAFVQERLDNLDRSAAALYDNAYETYRRETIRVFFQKPYTKAKPALFIDVLTRLLLDSQSALGASEIGVDSLSAELLTGPAYDDARQTLRQKRWWSDFQDVLAVVDNSLRDHDRVFGEKVFRSLKLQRTAAAQPYYEILAALDAAAAGDQAAFQENWSRALSTCTDLALLNTMQQWAIARRTPPDRVPASVVSLMEEAERLQNQRRSREAFGRLEKALQKMSDDYAPLLYQLGRLEYERGDTILAQKDFERARAAAPRYTAPRVATLRLLLDQNKPKEALAQADSTLQDEAYWLVYFPKARTLRELERYDEAVNVLRQRCEQLNDQSYALYVLLAEIYVDQQAWKGVTWAVQKAEELEPKRPEFITRLQTVREAVEESDKASLGESADSPAADPPEP